MFMYELDTAEGSLCEPSAIPVEKIGAYFAIPAFHSAPKYKESLDSILKYKK